MIPTAVAPRAAVRGPAPGGDAAPATPARRPAGARGRACRPVTAYATHAAHKPLLGSAAVAPVLSTFICDVLQRYWARSPTAVTAMELVAGLESPGAPVFLDHLAWRTFGAAGLGIASIAKVFLDFGYEERDDLFFTDKHLKATWFSPPHPDLPRFFASELQVKKLSERSQAVIDSYLARVGRAGEHAALLAATGRLPWGPVALADYEVLQGESPYAAWTLTNGYNLNHTTVAVHRLQGLSGGIAGLNAQLAQRGVRLSQSGGVLKVSPDGGLLQSSTVADTVEATFAGGSTACVAGSYLEFAERLVLPQHQHLPAGELREKHRRDGFAVGNAGHIFESTGTTQAAH